MPREGRLEYFPLTIRNHANLAREVQGHREKLLRVLKQCQMPQASNRFRANLKVLVTLRDCMMMLNYGESEANSVNEKR